MAVKITIITPGKAKKDWLEAGLAQYVKWLKPYCQIEFLLIKPGSDKLPPELVLAVEGRSILAQIRPQDYVVALDLAGLEVDSEQLALHLPAWLAAGGSKLTFVIGGAFGLAEPVLQRAQQRLSLSRLTLTHQMTRLLLLEQCYRSFCILQNKPYHK